MNELRLIESWDQLSAIMLPFLVRSGAAAICGAIIGLERELKGKAAGFRTNILICLGSSIYMTVGLLLVQASGSVQPASFASARWNWNWSTAARK